MTVHYAGDSVYTGWVSGSVSSPHWERTLELKPLAREGTGSLPWGLEASPWSCQPLPWRLGSTCCISVLISASPNPLAWSNLRYRFHPLTPYTWCIRCQYLNSSSSSFLNSSQSTKLNSWAPCIQPDLVNFPQSLCCTHYWFRALTRRKCGYESVQLWVCVYSDQSQQESLNILAE